MTLNEIRLYINALLNKDEFGGEINLTEYNYALKEYNTEFFKKQVQGLYAAEASGALNFDLIYASKALRPFIKNDTLSITTGVGDLSSLTNYAYLLKAMTTSAYNGEIKQVDLITHMDLFNRITNVLSISLADRPASVIEETNDLRVYPSNITSIQIAYLSLPETPVFDYYIDANDNTVYLIEGSSHALSAGETGSAGQTMVTVNSNTVELKYTDDFHPEFLNGLLGKLGIPSRDQIVMQTSMVNEQQMKQ